MYETMDKFEKQFVNMEVQAEFMESALSRSTSLYTPEGEVNCLMKQVALSRSTSLSTPEGEVNCLMKQVADDYGLEVSDGLPQPAAHAVPTASTEKRG